MSRYPFASLSSANGFSHPGPKCYEGSPPSSAKEITELKLSQGQWHEKALLPSSYFPVAPDMTLVILARKLLSSPFSSSIRSPGLLIFSCRCESNGHRHNLGRMSGLMTRQDRVACGSREKERVALVTGKCPETSFQIIPGHWAPSNPHPPITHHNLVIIYKLN